MRLYSPPSSRKATPFPQRFCGVRVSPLAQVEQFVALPTHERQLSAQASQVAGTASRLRKRPGASQRRQLRSVELKASPAAQVEQLFGLTSQEAHSAAHTLQMLTVGLERSTKSPAVEHAIQAEEVMLSASEGLHEVQFEARREQVRQELPQASHLPDVWFRKLPAVHAWQLKVVASYPSPGRHEPHLLEVPEQVAQGALQAEQVGGVAVLSKNCPEAQVLHCEVILSKLNPVWQLVHVEGDVEHSLQGD